jgi:Nucleotidyl transferase AbiEii toxin, Type IV TA system
MRIEGMNYFSPHLEILPAPQRTLWNELSEVSREFVLYGGTALALHLGHRNSVDFDLFGSRALDLSQIEQGISFLKGASIIQRDKNTLSAIVDRGGPVKVSFFGVPNPPRLSAAVVAEDNGLGVASILDLAGTKASVVQVRAEAKDYIDIDALITAGKVDLPLALSAAQRLYGSTFNPQITLKALSYFDDGDLRLLPEDMKLRLGTVAREVDLDHLPSIDKFTRQIDQDHGYEL